MTVNNDDGHGGTRAMIQLRIRDLETGMVLAKPVYSKDGCTLLNEGNVIDTRDIDRLRQWNKRFVYVLPPENDDRQSDHYAQAS